jgi:ubiquinol-cytochrome c reductase cytochrome b subunit
VKGPQDTVPFHPYYTVKDSFGICVFLLFYCFFIFYAPNYLGHPDNYTPANPLVTPAHIVPEWYFLPFYAILRAVPDIGIPGTHIVFIEAKLAGVLAMFGSIFVLFVLPWLDTSKVRSARFRPLYKKAFWVLVIACLALGWAGQMPPEGPALWTARIAGLYYFFHFLILLPILGRIEKPLPLPRSISEAVLQKA